jgi:hypothetical protein
MTDFYGNDVQIINEGDKILLSITYKYTDMKKLLKLFQSNPKFWYEFSSSNICYDGKNMDDIQKQIQLFKSVFIA